MGYEDFVDGNPLAAAELDNLMAQSVIICTSSTRPVSPAAGQHIYETDTSLTLVYHSATTGWKPPWSTAWGYVAGGTSTSDQSGITTVVDISGLSATWTAIATRRYLTTVFAPRISQHASASEINVLLTDGAGTFLTLASSTAPATNTTFAGMQWQESGLSGSTTRKARIQTVAGTCDVDGASYPGQIIVQDIGPSGVAP